MWNHESWMNDRQEAGGGERVSKTKGYKTAMKKHAAKTREHPRPLSRIAERKGKSSQLGNLVNGWKSSLQSSHEKALDKSKRRHENKVK